MEKRIITLCDIEVGGERGLVQHRKGIARAMTGTDYKDPQKVVKVVEIAENRERERERVVAFRKLLFLVDWAYQPDEIVA